MSTATSVLLGSRTTTTRQDVVLLIGRVALGIVLIAHGAQKLFTNGIAGTTAGFTQMGIPAPGISAWFAALVEFAGGIALIAGVLVPLVGVLVAVTMAGALFFVHAPNGVFVDNGGYELVLVIGALALVLAGTGAGAYSVDRLLQGSRRR